MKKSKFVNKTFDNGWICTGCNLAANYSHCTRHNRYWYACERRTSDGKCDKWIRLESWEISKVWSGKITVEEICQQRESKNSNLGIHDINYNFID